MLLDIHPDNPDERKIKKVVECLLDGGVIIYPTDTVYGMGCDIHNAKAFQKISQLKNIKPEKANFSIICHDLSHISEYTRHMDNTTYKVMKRALPGPFTFILHAGSSLPKHFKNKKKTIGIRIPDHLIPRAIVNELGRPILTTSVHDDDEILDYITDPYDIHEKFKDKVDIVIEGGFGHNQASTVVDCTTGTYEVLRQGLGRLEDIL
ncbi:MAG: threonylcarbamoyl-AMP synthase [Flavobacteriales bacterium]|nr:threonylcarbamoyl-AMP synthase [Flavobacteriales bacterium]MCB9448065.1 threonylcarbamoyl-AMP synthase [Flavobacteriales bacterium]